MENGCKVEENAKEIKEEVELKRESQLQEERSKDESSEERFTPINIKALATRVSPTLGKIVPKFMYRWFEKILHIKEINAFFTKHQNYEVQDFLDATVEFLDIKTVYEGRKGEGTASIEALKGQKVLFASNHPYGGPEAMVLFDFLHKEFPDCKLVAQSFLKFIKPLGKSCVYNKKEVRTLLNAVNERTSLLIYPAGYCSRMLSIGEVFDYDWKSSFVKIAKRNNMPIAVFYTYGQLSRRMHSWTKFRRIFHIKKSIETIFLVDEMFKLKGQTMKMVVGSIIEPDKLDDSVSNEEWAARIRQYCYELGKNPNLEFDYNKEATLPLM